MKGGITLDQNKKCYTVAEVQNILRESINNAGNFVDANGGEHYGYVIVTGETVTYRD